MKQPVSVEIRTQLYERVQIIAESEDMSPEELIDHAIRTYAEGWESYSEDEEDVDEESEELDEEIDDN
ncbi:MAG: hypothetical protein HPY73_03255 [Methanomassiliicoccales archaeon]|nr:MAG: hypothetical protein HPY73_03255 [Methanomassiliicoccales archaeon]